MAIIKKRDTMLMEEANELKKNIEDNNRCLAEEIEPLKKEVEEYELDYNKRKNAVKTKNKLKVNLFASIFFILAFGIVNYYFKSIFISILGGFIAFEVFKTNIYAKITSQIKPNEELEKCRLKIKEIQSNYQSKNRDIQEQLDKIEKGLNGEVDVAELIEKNLTDKFVLLNDIVIPTEKGTTQIDHVLITPRRIICIETKSSEGIYYPNKNGWMWYPTKRQKYGRTATGVLQENPALQSTYHSNSLKAFINKNNMDYVVDAIVVLSNQYSIFKGDNRYCEILTIHKLIEYLKLDDVPNSVISTNEANNISELLIKCDEADSNKHYEKYSNVNPKLDIVKRI